MLQILQLYVKRYERALRGGRQKIVPRGMVAFGRRGLVDCKNFPSLDAMNGSIVQC